MYSLRMNVWKKVIRSYHKIMHDYNYILYRDCIDNQMKIALFEKIIYHSAKIDENK
jgi:hypothetical protein